MKKSLLLSLWIALPCSALAKEPTAESINRLLDAAEIQQTTLDQMVKFSAMVDAMVNETVVKQKLTPAQTAELKKRLPEFSASLQKIIVEEMQWEKVKSSYAKIYAKNFTQEEVNGLITFYKSPAGKAFLEKMPLVNEEITNASVDRLPAITARVKKASAEFIEKLQPAPPRK